MGNSSNSLGIVNESFEVRLIRKSPTAKFQSLYLIREKRSYLYSREYMGQVIKRKITQYNIAGEGFLSLVI